MREATMNPHSVLVVFLLDAYLYIENYKFKLKNLYMHIIKYIKNHVC
jgi:hypothetical protein